MQTADFRCCLTGLGSINTPKCIVYMQREEIMSKASWLRDSSDNDKSCAGRSLLEMLEDELDESFDRLMDGTYADDPENLNKCKGRAEGLTFAIAVIRGPYAPNIDATKGQAVARFQERMADHVDSDLELEDA